MTNEDCKAKYATRNDQLEKETQNKNKAER